NRLDDPRVRGMIVVSRDVTERRRADAHTALLLDVVRDLAGALEPEPALQQVLERTARGVPCELAAAWLYDRERRHWRAAASVGLSPELREVLNGLRFATGEPFDGLVMRGETVVAADPAEQSWLSPELCATFDLGAFVAAPLRRAGR